MRETTWAHIQAAQASIQEYGLPVRYYVDSLRVFRFVQDRDSFWRKHVLETDDVDTQWRKMMRVAGVDVNYALSPQAKGKVERLYRWLQDRIVRSCAYETLSSFDDVRSVLKSEVLRYNNHLVHSTTGEIPNLRFVNPNVKVILCFAHSLFLILTPLLRISSVFVKHAYSMVIAVSLYSTTRSKSLMSPFVQRLIFT